MKNIVKIILLAALVALCAMMFAAMLRYGIRKEALIMQALENLAK